jgi:Domain of unknown function (DUF6016)
VVTAREVRYGAAMTPSQRPQHVTEPQLAQLADAAAASARRRSHILLHADHQDQVQRLLIALEPDSYVRPHVHSEQWEMIVLLRGRLDLLIFGQEAAHAAAGDERGFARRANPARHLARRGRAGVANPGDGSEARPLPAQRICRLGPGGRHTATGAFVRWAKGADLGAKWQKPASAA